MRPSCQARPAAILYSLWISSTSLAISLTGSTLKRGKMDSTASMIEKAIIAIPTYFEAYNNVGVLYRDAGDIAQAINAHAQCLKIDPDSRNAGQVPMQQVKIVNHPHLQFLIP